ncbi:Gfo/Idh/MocA family oxidoreductase, partial [Crocinitomicaceae bacterium]|nr:Gfo/Idh/MocA family oxidoreductase [Crocinitomicaceae bacterium]
MDLNQKVKFAVIGAGHIGKRHAEMIRREEESELVAMVDVRSKEECDAVGFDVPFYNSIEDLITSGIEFHV